jgi:hypothetical protein
LQLQGAHDLCQSKPCTPDQVLIYSALASSGNADMKTVVSSASQDLRILRFLIWVGFVLSIDMNNFIL